ncbi:putative small ubiquitin-related modifier [Histomonas meleagridis]|uniref:putative small ubiquitin-related modifier n=1 Tax=Histomonas meleagridis TaxID=135588 RepID=UPI003559F8D7|nr:putative small ubiquitin-related modifier [Histomonas meleagridis]KAH0800150.1 putative small ubiquitin-related modifier [Histomonas meleagridis]
MESETSPKPDPSQDSSTQETVNLTIKDPQGEEIYFRVKKRAKMGRLFNVYCKRTGIDPTTMRFFHQGERINEEQTPDDLNLKDGDVIDAFVRQVAGMA